MATAQNSLLTFNRGLISPLGLARTDLARTSLSAEQMTNWVPRVLGSMMLRPGLGYVGTIQGDYAPRIIPFVFSATDTAIMEFTNAALRLWIGDVLLTRPAVAATVANGSFETSLSSWVSADEVGASSIWAAGGFLALYGTGTNRAIRTQQVTVTNPGVEHALRVDVTRGPVVFKVGSTSGGDDYIRVTTLDTGQHSLAFTPTGNFHIWFGNALTRPVLISACTVEAAGVVSIPTPWTFDKVASIRAEQSADVVFIACEGVQQRKIERRAARSWSVVAYEVDDGPFRIQNVSGLTLTPSALTGLITLTASRDLFRTTQVGSLWRITSKGQLVSANLSGGNQFTNTINVVGVGDRRAATVEITGTWVGSIVRQRSFDSADGPWEDVEPVYTTINKTETFNDGFNNSIIWYRFGFPSGGYTSGTAFVTIHYAAGSIDGIVRTTGYISTTQMQASVIRPLGALTASDDWAEGAWSDFRGWPSAVAFHDGRLWWAGKSNLWGSVSDGFNSFDDAIEGDSGPISRSIGSGPVDRISWLLSAKRLFIGGDAAERVAQASTLDEVLTPTNLGMREASTLGSANVPAVRVDATGFFVQRGGARVYALTYDEGAASGIAKDVMVLAPEVGVPAVVRSAVQRLPDTRLHFVRTDGRVALLVYDQAEEVNCWVLVETDGAVEDALVLPGVEEDRVYYAVRRTVNGIPVRHLERWALESEAVGGIVTKLSDAHGVYSGPAVTTIPGLGHLEGRSVVVWAGGADLGTFTVSSGVVTLPTAVTSAVVGLPYIARFKSTKLSDISNVSRVSKVGLLLANTHARGLRYGPSFEELDALPLTEDYEDVPPDQIWGLYAQDSVEFPGRFTTDSRVCLEATSPRACTVLGVSLRGESSAR